MDEEKNNEGENSSKRSWRQGDRSKISIMHIFRAAYYERDARIASGHSETGEAEITKRSKQRRDGVDEATLKAQIQADLSALMNTIQLDSAVPLDDVPYVRQSVLNYGFRDLSDVTPQELGSSAVVNSIRQSLLDHEPRIIPSTLDVRVTNKGANTRNRLEISVSAELMSDPVDVPVDFEAEVDLGAGKLKMQNLRVQS